VNKNTKTKILTQFYVSREEVWKKFLLAFIKQGLGTTFGWVE
jgi:hypothetical protein